MIKTLFTSLAILTSSLCFAQYTPLELAEALDTTNLVWSTGGDTLWYHQTNVTYDAEDALQSGDLEDSELSWLQVSTTISGLLHYSTKVSSETNSDYLLVYQNGVAIDSLSKSGEIDWTTNTIVVPAGTNTFNWTYAKDANGFSSNDCAWIDAVFLEPMPIYTIATTSAPPDSGILTGAGAYAMSSTCTVYAVASTGYTFSAWSDIAGVVAVTTNYTFEVTENRTLSADFAPLQYTLSLSSSPTNGGTTAGGGLVNYNSNIVVYASPNSGYSFSNWAEGTNIVSTSTNYTFSVSGDMSLVANFIPSYTISTSSSPTAGGSTSGGGVYSGGSSCTVVASNNAGYTFSSWQQSGTNVSTSASYSFTVTAPMSLVAVFSLNSYTISTSSSPTAGGSTSGGGTYNYGASCTVIASRSPGYSFVNWTIGGSTASTSSSYGFTVSGSKSIVANFSYTSSLSDAVDSLLTFSTGGVLGYEGTSTSWYRQTAYKHDGTDSARSGNIGDAMSESGTSYSYMQAYVTGPGTITFWWKIDNEDTADKLAFYISGTKQAGEISGNTSWAEKTYSIPSGAQTLKWQYTKDFIGGFNSDAGFVDQITWTPD